MGKHWDYDVPSIEIWQEVLRVLKPGGYLLSFAGTRTQHRMAVRIEDAGFEIRDMIAWVYGSGFPKSLNIGKVTDKFLKTGNASWNGTGDSSNGALGYSKLQHKQDYRPEDYSNRHQNKDEITEAQAKQWEGWGTALKPSHEDITVAQKPYTNIGDYDIMVQRIISNLCQLPSLVSIVKKNFPLSQNVLGEGLSIAQWIAENNTNTQDALSVLMATLQSELETNSSLNTELSWLNILGVLLKNGNTYTTETKTSLIIDLQTLNSLLSQITLSTTIKGETRPNGDGTNVLIVDSFFNVLGLKLKTIHELFAGDCAISQAGEQGLRPKLEPITVARKPLEGTVAENCLKWGVGGINIDGCRVNVDREAEPREYDKEGASGMNCGNSGFGTNLKKSTDFMTTGRFPANLIHDGSDEVVSLFPNSKSSDAVRHNNPHKSGSMAGATNGGESFGFNDSGSAARFFYKATFNYKDICQDPSQISFAQYVESKLTGHGKLTVQEAVEILEAQEDLPYQQELQAIRDCIGSFKNSTQIPKDVGAAKWENTDIILIMLNLLKLSGYARLAIEGNTNSDTKAKAEQKSEHARFLYQAKASKSERNRGCEGLPLGEAPASARSKPAEGRENALGEPRANNHPTVKPIALMEYLVKLVTKPNHIVIDPFTGSGSTLIACKNLGRRYIGIERESEYCKIAETRLAAVKTLPVLF